MKLIIGLGNLEEKYANTRHNVGFAALDQYARAKGLMFQPKDKFKAAIAESNSSDEKVIFAKPSTYYNLVGESARVIADFYKIEPADILIVHDELALPFGVVRTRLSGSAAGNNGIKSIIEHIGHDTPRLRIGIHNDLATQIHDADFVLGKFTKDESVALRNSILPKAIELIDEFINGNHTADSHTLI
ncbi:MAG TPA: aminoacyl-tRNA hydrolase [Candidatus Saccharimonadales bacterium]|nr:aminoacyl-tRNA hydrolase [Candidatus Saccharimonadales bacterium]